MHDADALKRRVRHERFEPATFVRHFEDAARIVAAENRLPTLDYPPRALAEEMLAQGQIVALPSTDDAALLLVAGARTDAIRAAHAAIAQMFWGARIPLDEACATLRAWVDTRFRVERIEGATEANVA